MKKNPIIFIAMLIALAFTSCQMNTDDSVVIPPAPTYTIKVNATNGTASYPNTAKAGEKVTITATAYSGYVFDNASSAFPDFKVSDDKKSITWNLTMPEKDVTINVTFKAATSTPTTEATYTINNPDGTVFASGLTHDQAIAQINNYNLVEGTDYTLSGTTYTLTTSGLNKINGSNNNGGNDNGNGNGENNGNVVYGSKRIILPTVEHGTIKITNKSGTKAYKDGNTVLSNAGADVGDVIEIKLVPDTGYNYFAYENTLTVTSIGSVTLTKSDDTTYTFTMPNNDVEVNGLPFGFEQNYSATFSTPNVDNLSYYSNGQSGFMWLNNDKVTFNPGTKVYVLTYMQNLIEPVTVTEVTETIRSNYSDGYVTIDGVEIRHTVKPVYKYYSFTMPRENLTLKFVETNQQ